MAMDRRAVPGADRDATARREPQNPPDSHVAKARGEAPGRRAAMPSLTGLMTGSNVLVRPNILCLRVQVALDVVRSQKINARH